MSQKQSKLICECGKEFNESQSFNGHKSRCKVHHLAKYGNLDVYNSHNKKSAAYRRMAGEKRRQSKLQQWLDERHTCKHCGKIMTEKYGEGIFCSTTCRAIYNNQHRKKLESPIVCEICGREFYTRQGYIMHRKFENGEFTASANFIYSKHKLHSVEYYQNKKTIPKVCAQCGKEFPVIPYKTIYDNGLSYQTKFCSPECRQKHQHEALSRSAKQCHIDGRMHSFAPRDNLPKSEEFWIKSLSGANIPYVHEQRVSHKPTEICSGYWFLLDFCVYKGDKKIDLEIDGKQHNYADRKAFDAERNQILESLGYIVYRIDISKSSQEDWESQFNDFVDWYNSI